MTTEAEPMDLSDIAVADFIDRARREGAEVGIFHMQSLFRAALAIRDAATTAERRRAIAIVERQPLSVGSDVHSGACQQWVKDQILAALRGGET